MRQHTGRLRDQQALLDFDREHVWHPYTSLRQPLPCYLAHSAEGAELTLGDGRKLIDGVASWWCAIHGYRVPELDRALQAQCSRMAHVMFGGLTHEPAIELCRKLVALTPAKLDRVFLADSGSVAVEVALKMALQYWRGRGDPRSCFVALRHGYHGDTFGAMSVCDPVQSMHSLYAGCLPQQLFAPAPTTPFAGPWQPADAEGLARVLAQGRGHIAALILEPIVQNAGGIRIYHPEYLASARQLCDEHGILLIADEIATGFGRTGRMFACEHAAVTPDIMCVGKALTGGYLSLAATLTTEEVAHTLGAGDTGLGADSGNLMHGPTFMGNPLACAVARASLGLLEARDWRGQVARIEGQLRRELEPARGYSTVADVRVLGAIGALELSRPVDVAKMQAAFVERGVWVRPFGRLVYLMPPYVIRPEQLSVLTGALLEIVREEPLLAR